MVRVAFKRELVNVFSEDERKIILSAIFHHSDKKHIHDEYDELLKDADVLQHFLFSDNWHIHYDRELRLNKVLSELSIEKHPLYLVSQKKKHLNI